MQPTVPSAGAARNATRAPAATCTYRGARDARKSTRTHDGRHNPASSYAPMGGKEEEEESLEWEGDESWKTLGRRRRRRRARGSRESWRRWCARLRKEAASEQRGNKGLVSPLRCGYYIVPGRRNTMLATVYRAAIKAEDRCISGDDVFGAPRASRPAAEILERYIKPLCGLHKFHLIDRHRVSPFFFTTVSMWFKCDTIDRYLKNFTEIPKRRPVEKVY